jgi:hypothetical protein
MAAELKPKLTFDEYLEIEGKAEFKSEFVNGWMYAMGGASPEHNQIVANLHNRIWRTIEKTPMHSISERSAAEIREARAWQIP